MRGWKYKKKKEKVKSAKTIEGVEFFFCFFLIYDCCWIMCMNKGI